MADPQPRPCQRWARGAGEYLAGSGADAEGRQPAGLEPPGRTPAANPELARDFGISWAPFSTGLIQASGIERARHGFRAQLPELIWNAAALEGNNFTLPEVRTLLEGVTVGGRRLADEQQIIALSDAYYRLDELVGSGEFHLAKSVSDELHSLVARHEARESGRFRGEGKATGGGTVRLSTGGLVQGIDHGERGEALRGYYAAMLDGLAEIEDARERALIYFASAVRRQYYFDGNKRTARLMVAGELMSHGFDAVSVPFARRLEFNTALDDMFSADDATSLLAFLATCTIDS